MSRRSLYKAKIREENTISTRRQSRCLERKQNRDDEVNKRRLLSNDDLSLVEDSFQQDEDERPAEPVKRAVRQKVNTQLERLQKWREEKKRKIDQEKQNKKPTFRVTSVAYKGETELYKKDGPKEVKQANKNDKGDSAKLSSGIKKVVDSNKLSSATKKVDSTKRKVKADSSQTASHKPASSGGISSAKSARITKSAKPQATIVVSNKSEQPLHASKPSTRKNAVVTQVTVHHRRDFSDLSKKQTVSAAAKVKINLETEKPKEFLRGKSRVTRSTVPNKKIARGKKENIAEQQKEETQQVVNKDDVVQEGNLLDDISANEPNRNNNTSDVKDLHLSDSTVPTPKHSTPAPRRSAHVKKEIENIRKLEFEDAGMRKSQRLKVAHIVLSRVETELDTTLEQIDTAKQSAKMKSASTKRKSVRIVSSDDSDKNSENDMGATKYPTTPYASNRRSTRARNLAHEELHSSPYVSASDDRTSHANELALSVLTTPTPSTRSTEKEVHPNLEQVDPQDTHLPVSECGTLESEQRANLKSASAKRKSVRISALVFSSASDTNSENDMGAAKYPRTPGARRQRNTRAKSSGQEEGRKSGHVSMSDEETSAEQEVMNKENTADQIKREMKEAVNSGHVIHEGNNLQRETVLSDDSSYFTELHLSATTPSTRHDEYPTLEQTDNDDTQLPVFENATLKSEQRAKMRSASSKRKSVRIAGIVSSDSDLNSENELVAATYPRTPGVRSQRSTRARGLAHEELHSSTYVSVSDEGTSDDMKELHHSSDLAVTTPSTRHDEIELYPTLEQTDNDDTQLPVFENTPLKSERAKMRSASSKRKSVRIISSASDPNSENELVAAKYPRTPGIKSQRNTRARSLALEEHHSSTYVSVSDEGTSDNKGESVDELKVQDTSRNVQHAAHSKGTPSSNDHNTATVYLVGKPGESEPSSRALQELVVEKLEGEVSFIEVPMDDSTDGNVVCETMSPKHSNIVPSDDQVMVDDISSTTEVDSQSTQPFTPRRSNDMSKLTVSSTQSSATPVSQGVSTSFTPRSSRSRRSLNALSFKTPSQPASALRSKSKRRKTEHSAIKSPEQMIKILQKSPMIELTRRRSRHIGSPALGAASPSLHKFESTVTKSTDTTSTNELSCGGDLTTTTISQPCDPMQLDLNGSVTHGVKHFRDLLLSETNGLNQLCNKWNEVSSGCLHLSEEARGHIRSTVGKAHLLMDQRFKQFSGLIDDCEFSLGEKETTLTDLQGFWDMIHFQVDDVHQLFAALNDMEQNNWEIQQPVPTKDVPKQRKAVKIYKPKIKSNFAAFREEMKRRKVQAANGTSSAATTVEDPETKVFDAGYFKVNSPVISPSVKISQLNTPLKPMVSDTEQSTSQNQDSVSQVVDMPAQSSVEQLSTPASQGNKENKIANPLSRRFSSMSAKRLSYLPVVPSPLLNDFTGQTLKK